MKKAAIWKFSQMAALVSVLIAFCALPVAQGARDYAACYPAARYLLTLEYAGGSYCRSSLIVTKR